MAVLAALGAAVGMAACDSTGSTEPGCPALLQCCAQVSNSGQQRTCQDLHAQSLGQIAASDACFEVLQSFVLVGSCSAALLDGGADLGGRDQAPDRPRPDLVGPPDVPPTCSPENLGCTFDTDCCSGLICDTLFLSCVVPCGASGASCSADSGCCSGLCDPLFAQCVSCRSQSDGCVSDSECCSGYCDASGYCADSQPSCYPLDSSCSYDSDCCSGYCCDGYCSSSCGSTCVGDGSFCNSSSECCSNDCLSNTCQGG